MRIFVFEYVTGGGMLDACPTSSLAREGDMMLQALLADLCMLGDVECLVTRDARLPVVPMPVDCRFVRSQARFPDVWAAALAESDAVWPVAPEHRRTLERVSAAILAAGKGLLNSSPAAVNIAASKLRTARLLESQGIAVVPTFGPGEVIPDIKGRWVLKPDDGAGCEGIRLYHDRDSLCRDWDSLADWRNQVAQPFIHGTSASLSFLAKAGEATLLSINRQRVAIMDDRLVLLGCVVNGLGAGDPRFRRLAEDVAAALPGLWGYVGLDLVITQDGLPVLEINPRLTSSYAGLSESLGLNTAGQVLELYVGGRPEEAIGAGRAVDVCLEYAGAA
ncbi:ATP-grasp domain-containing protein [Thiocapsa rosea]|uniref:Putative ATP-grasp superfamily ATP-dependent carboligase n=1 Tax=Thiocapsa rosea TaxID=69360 RepID=A0A495VGY3_9GAMM|nr:ATP-grasp domain-containing protein [Thiocapsa rosea]RKT47118.1 putative ATP-grasp superfamily ATP-dependent carboligase [Thiocapsa rosea]